MDTPPPQASQTPSNWTLPNLLTILRVVLTPAFVAVFMDHNHLAAFAIFAAAGLTDALDGTLARLLRQRSNLGAMLDPLADKMLLVASFVCLAIQGLIPLWLAVIVVSRDIIIVGGLLLLTFLDIDVKSRIRPTFVSKLNTTAQMTLVAALLTDKAFDLGLGPLLPALIWTVAGLTAASGLHYLRRGLDYFTPNGEAKPKPD
ncbi:MAG: CDP-alcohol phosphatidyltransferase family protein [Desulfovibrionaceae bacterium]|nr:CDP-alcohol phosphatidyltransferase family protein [Desulfovibrionaceae bacterium]MBF0513888.1 CDP-alcohol phosphatidyltransferase family protein [Desulfovibrionaceae bacterium]